MPKQQQKILLFEQPQNDIIWFLKFINVMFWDFRLGFVGFLAILIVLGVRYIYEEDHNSNMG